MAPAIPKVPFPSFTLALSSQSVQQPTHAEVTEVRKRSHDGPSQLMVGRTDPRILNNQLMDQFVGQRTFDTRVAHCWNMVSRHHPYSVHL